MIIFMARAKKMAKQWGERKRLQEQLALKLEGMRAKKVVQPQSQRTVRRSLPLGTR
jgi:hypothetical protein